MSLDGKLFGLVDLIQIGHLLGLYGSNLVRLLENAFILKLSCIDISIVRGNIWITTDAVLQILRLGYPSFIII